MSTGTHLSNRQAQPIRILIVDDMREVRQEMRTLLQLTGELQVVGEAANGQEAVTLAEQLHPDVIVMDLEMPVMDGITATRLLKQRGLAIRIIILSVHADTETVRRAREAGAEVFVDKAARPETLLSVLAALHSTVEFNKEKR